MGPELGALFIAVLSVVSCYPVWRILRADPNMAPLYAAKRMFIPDVIEAPMAPIDDHIGFY